MRWLLLKDLLLLRRSPLVTFLLVAYPIAIALLIGFALSGGPERPRVALLNLVPQDEPFNLGGQEFDVPGARDEFCDRLECVRVSNEQEARDRVMSGDVLGALIIPETLIEDLESLGSLTPREPRVRVLVNEEDPVKARLVDDRISALVTEANLRLSEEVSTIAGEYLDLIVRGGEISIFGQTLDILGLESAASILRALEGLLPEGTSAEVALRQVIEFAGLAAQNLDFAEPLLGSVAQPIEVDKEIVAGDAPSLDAFAIGVAATVTLMFVTVLLVAGSLALEREENAYPRLTRGLVTPHGLLAEKVALGVVASFVVTLVMLLGLELFVPIEWSRAPLIALAILGGGAAFAAFGAAIGAATREVRASSLLAFMVSLPIAFLSLVPSGTVSPTLFDFIGVVAAAFPFAPALDAMSGGLDAGGPSLGVPLAHLAGLALAYLALARVAMRRFA